MPRDPETTYRIMSAVKSKNTVPERLLGRAMWRLGLRYRKHGKIIGRPDFVFSKVKIAVFCDGDFWHGNNWRNRGLKNRKQELAGYSSFWVDKITKNVERDKVVNRTLRRQGWLVLRFWETRIRRSTEACALRVFDAYRSKIYA